MSEQLTSRGLALAAAGLNLVVCAAVVAVLVLVGKESPPDTVFPAALPPLTEESVPPAVTEQRPSTTPLSVSSTPSVAANLQNVAGPGGMTTAIPTGWPTARAPGPGAMQATDPADSTRYLRFGGSAVPDQDSYPTRQPLVDAYWGSADPSYVDDEKSESFIDVHARARQFLTMLSRLDGGSVAAFSHGLFMRVVIWVLLTGETAPDTDSMRRFFTFRTTYTIPNASIITVNLNHERGNRVLGATTAHLPHPLRTGE